MTQDSPFIFFGSNQFSVGVLETLVNKRSIPKLIVTVQDAPVGRKQTMTPPPIKTKAHELGIPCVQPNSLKKDSDIGATIASYQPDFGIVAAYRKFFDKKTIDLFLRGVLVVHPSLLPTWRGPSPIETALANGDTQTGVSIMLLDEEMDHGPILAQEKTAIGQDEYFEQLYLRLSVLGGDLLARTIPPWLENKLTPLPQNHRQATFSKMLSLQNGEIRAYQPMSVTYNKIRAFSYEPGCWIQLNIEDKTTTLKIIKSIPLPNIQPVHEKIQNGLCIFDKKLALVCKGDKMLELETVQPQGGKPMTGGAFLNGYRHKLGL